MEWQETVEALGGVAVLGKDVISGVAFARKVEQGLPRSAIARLKRFTHFSDSDLAEVIPRRTLTSMRGVKKLSTSSTTFAPLPVRRSRNGTSRFRTAFGESNHSRARSASPNTR